MTVQLPSHTLGSVLTTPSSPRSQAPERSIIGSHASPCVLCPRPTSPKPKSLDDRSSGLTHGRWNTINNVEKRAGTSVPGAMVVWMSVVAAVTAYYRTLPLAGLVGSIYDALSD
jgi:hypothetical protein